jgi:minor extracellular serine protease Vpr
MVAASLSLSLLASAALAAPGAPPGRASDDGSSVASEATGYAVVTFADPPAIDHDGEVRGQPATKAADGARFNPRAAEVRAYRAHLQGVHGDFERWLARTAAGAQVVGSLELVANAVTVELNGTDPAVLRRGPGVRDVELSTLYRPTMSASVELIGAPEVWPDLGGRDNAGEGIKVGIIDSGIDPEHPFFDCEVGELPKLLGARTYASGVAGPGIDIVFDHGTHVAGTVAGCVIEGGTEHAPAYLEEGDAISGVAPGASLFDYNVFPGFGGGYVAFGGSAFSHDIAAALEDAVEDGMHVVNLSLGGTPRGPNDLLDMALNRTVRAGVVAAVSAGNEGPGAATVGSPGTADEAITVGATTNSHVVGSFIEVFPDDGDAMEPFAGAAGDYDPFTQNPADGERLSDWGGLACEPASAELAAEVAGTVTLVDRGGCTFGTKVRNAEATGAIGVLIVNNIPGEPGVGPAHDGGPFPEIPALGISFEQGEAVREAMPATVTISGIPQAAPAEPNVLAAFSSRGPTTFTRALKPEIVAPGVNIVSSVFTLRFEAGQPVYDHGWAAFQGTSMAAPHVAGAAALLLDDDASLTPRQVKSALVNNADDLGHGVLEQGAGLLDVPAAVAADVYASPATVSFGHVTGNTNRAFAPVTVALSGATETCGEVATAGAPVVDATLEGDQVTVAVTVPTRSLPTGGHEGVVTVSCGDQDLRIPWYLQVDRNR